MVTVIPAPSLIAMRAAAKAYAEKLQTHEEFIKSRKLSEDQLKDIHQDVMAGCIYSLIKEDGAYDDYMIDKKGLEVTIDAWRNLETTRERRTDTDDYDELTRPISEKEWKSIGQQRKANTAYLISEECVDLINRYSSKKHMPVKRKMIEFMEEIKEDITKNPNVPYAEHFRGKSMDDFLWEGRKAMVRQGEKNYIRDMLEQYKENPSDDKLKDLYLLRKSPEKLIKFNRPIAKKINETSEELGIEDEKIRSLGKIDTIFNKPTINVKKYLSEKGYND